MKTTVPFERQLLYPVIQLFDRNQYTFIYEAPLGGRKIDILLNPKNHRLNWIAIELKVRNWKSAFRQARTNFQIADRSYIALWKDYAHLPFSQEKLLKAYGVGLIEVGENYAKTLLVSNDIIANQYRSQNKNSIRHLLI